MPFRPALFRKPGPADRDRFPWWHPASLMRAGWNLAFSASLGAGVGFLVLEFAAQIVARLTGDDWQDWHDPLSPLAWLVGCFVAFVAYMSYRMDDKTD